MNSKASATIGAMTAFLTLAISVQSPAQKIITFGATGAGTTSGSLVGHL